MSAQTEDKRFQKPWVIVENPESFVVRSANGINIAYVYFEDKKGRADVMGRMNRKQALAIANRIAMIGA